MFDLTADKIVNIADDAGIMALLGVGADIAPVMALLGVGADIAPVSEEGPEFKAALIKALEAEPDQPAQTLFLSVTMELGIKDAAPLEVYFAVFLAVWRRTQAPCARTGGEALRYGREDNG